MKIIALVVFITLLTFNAHATELITPVSTCSAPPIDNTAITTDFGVRYADRLTGLSFNNTTGISDRTMDIAIPNTGTNFPLVIVVHGGAWWSGFSGMKTLTYIIQQLATYGYAAVAPNYRLVLTHTGGVEPADFSNIFPANISDLRCNLRYLVANAATYGIDTSRIVIMGSSSGSHDAALLALTHRGYDFPYGAKYDDGNCPLTDRLPEVQAFIGYYGVYNFDTPDTTTSTYTCKGGSNCRSDYLGQDVATAPPELIYAASPIDHLANDPVPSMLLMYGSADTVIPPQQSIDLYNRTQKKGLVSTIVEIAEEPHGFPMLVDETQFSNPSYPNISTSTCTALATMKQVFGQ